jgi:hypothetical protein
MILTLQYPINGQIVSVPNEILLTEKYSAFAQNTHLVLDLQSKTNMMHTFKLLFLNGDWEGGYVLGESILKMKYVPCTLEQYRNMKVFL